MPSFFVIPSLLNLVEILRSRWHLGNILNSYIDRTIGTLGSGANLSAVTLLDEMFQLRIAYAYFLRDPVPYLFDGGSVTEIAEEAQKELWLVELRDVIQRKFAVLERLTGDIIERQRLAILLKS